MAETTDKGSEDLKKERARLQEERKNAADRIAASMRLIAIGQLAAGMAHELNNPLSVILGFAQSMARHDEDRESLRASLRTVEREALRCKRLVQDLLNFSRPSEPRKAMENAAEVVEGALTLVEPRARMEQVKVIRDFPDNLPPVYVDGHRLQQMIINLCTNALDAMPGGGELTVRIAALAPSKENPLVEISVSDTGTGIPPEIRERIFDPFFTTKKRGKGTGLGLSLVRDIVREHDADLQVHSKPGEGTTFAIRFPADARQACPLQP